MKSAEINNTFRLQNPEEVLHKKIVNSPISPDAAL